MYKDTTLHEVLASVDLVSAFYLRQRTDAAFNRFYNDAVKTAQSLATGEPQLPRYRRPPTRIDAGTYPHNFSSPRD